MVKIIYRANKFSVAIAPHLSFSYTVERSITRSAESKEAVNGMVDKAVAAGGTSPDPATDYGFMYQHSFDDPDGHHWEYMDGSYGIPEHQG